MPHDTRDSIIDFVRYWSEVTGLPAVKYIGWLQIQSSKYYNWKDRYGKANEHNGLIPRDFWLEAWERQAIIDYHHKFPAEGYRRLTFMMLDNNIVAVSPSSTYRVLSGAGLLQRWSKGKSKKGNGFTQPLGIHEHWHIDMSYINICGTFYYLCTILDGCSRYIVHWELRESMTEQDIEIVLQRAREQFPKEKPRIISDNGPQFVSKDFKEYIRFVGMTHVRTSPYYPQSNGKIERWHGTLKRECIRPGVLLSLEDARRVVGDYIHHYNNVRLNSAIGYIAPIDKLNGRSQEIFRERDEKLELARQARKKKRSGGIRGNNPPHQVPISSAGHSVGALYRNRALTGFPAAVEGS
ncbi:IS3 family transposase [Desulfopila sp. IMCC35008]|uniref:IS3 family transposase n=1 Tax=Desulfopila sp. IMCC35008 TaxID=2653858 RepID=UPI001F0D38A6|nr:IS3 family transposase [Desulfopila sp. IMCC35008]